MHCIWTLPSGDDDFSNRWKSIKIPFVQAISRTERRSSVRIAKGERGILQRRFWEHVIRNDADYSNHVEYVHWNPVKHGLVKRVADWPFSSFHRYVQDVTLPIDWVGDVEEDSNGFGELHNE